MPNLPKHLYLYLFLSLASLSAQNCIDYGEFEGPECVCAPDGWNMVIGTEEIDPPWQGGGPCDFGESPTGGNVVAFNVTAPGWEESIETTIDGLTPGVTYNLAFWYLSMECDPICCSNFLAIVDGEDYEFDANSEWTLAEICVEAESEQMEITILGTHEGNQGNMFVDDVLCDAVTPCCELTAIVPEELSVCPNTDLVFDTEYDNESGPVTYEWDSDPSDGISFLSATDVQDPIFHFPWDDPSYEGEEYLFTVTMNDGACAVTEELLLEVFPIIEMTFDFDDYPYCQQGPDIVFPNVSNEGISGTWNISSIDPDDHPDEDITIYFTPSSAEVDCPLTSEYEIEIWAYEVPTFDLPEAICKSSNIPFIFPETSFEHIDGEWSVEEFIPSEWLDNSIIVEFFPDDPFCKELVSIEIELLPGNSVSFNLPMEFCRSSDVYVLPLETEEGVGGSWSNPNIDISQNGLDFSQTFTPVFENDICYEPYIYMYDVVDAIVPSFDTISPICRTSGIIVLDSFTQQDVIGYWSIPSFDPDTVIGAEITSIWTPLDDSETCISDTLLVFEIEESVIPLFNYIDTICKNSNVFVFPVISENQISGTWTPDSFDPELVTSESVTSRFTPGIEYCSEEVDWRIFINDAVSPIFTLPKELCELDEILILPTVSDNNFQGDWSIPEIIPYEMAGESLMVTFTTNDHQCVQDYILEIRINETEEAIFSLPEYFCQSDPEFVLPMESENGFEGEFQNQVINPSLISAGQNSIVFIPEDEMCVEPFVYDFEVIPEFDVSYLEIHPMSCNSGDGIIQFEGVTNNLGNIVTNQIELSFDAGTTWQNISDIQNLSAGLYQLLFRYIQYPNCLQEYGITLLSPDAPEFTSIDIENESGCQLEDGQIIIFAIGDNLIYSIDDGITFQMDNTFSNLQPGEYNIVIQEEGTSNCQIESLVEIFFFPVTMINVVDVMDQSVCTVNDGQIIISAEGQNLEYSIDGGQNFFDLNVFDDLSSGTYEIVVRSKDDISCYEDIIVLINGPMRPSIADTEIGHVNYCEQDIGFINILGDGTDIEYSIDGGNSWFPDGEFSGLSEGAYEIVIRDMNNPSCFDEDFVIIEYQEASLSEPDISEISPSNCNVNDGSLIISSLEENIEFSIDNGVSWQSSGIFTNLGSGTYDVVIRKIGFDDCTSKVSYSIEEVDCPCNELTVSVVSSPVSCEDQDNGQITLDDISGGLTNLYEVNWQHGEQGFFVENLSAGWYYYNINYDDVCMWSDSVYIEKFDPINFGLEIFNADCKASNNGVIEVIEVGGGTGNYNYSIDGNDFQSENVFYNLSPDEYLVYVLDDNNCIKSELVEINTEFIIEIDLPEVMEINLGESVYLNPLIDESSIDSFYWTPTFGINNPNELIAYVTPLETTIYTLDIYYGECLDQRQVVVEVDTDLDLFLGNVFSPNGDGREDIFYIQSNNLLTELNCSMYIYDRWGNLIFLNEDTKPNRKEDGWDGYYNGNEVASGVYVYLLEYKLNDKRYTLSGSVTLLK